MTPETGLHLSQLAMLFGAIIVAGGVWGYNHFKDLRDLATDTKRDQQFAEVSSKLDELITSNKKLSTQERAAIERSISAVGTPHLQQLEHEYDLGYAMLRLTGADYYYVPKGVQLNVNWDSTKILAFNDRSVVLRLPDFTDNANNLVMGNTASVERRPGATVGLPAINTYRMRVETLANSASDVTVVVGFSRRR